MYHYHISLYIFRIFIYLIYVIYIHYIKSIVLPEKGGIFKKYALHWILLRESLKVPFVFGSSI